MSNSTRTELFGVLAKLSDQYPHWRVGQLVANMAGIAEVNIWDVEDEQLLAVAKDHLEQRSAMHGSSEETRLSRSKSTSNEWNQG